MFVNAIELYRAAKRARQSGRVRMARVLASVSRTLHNCHVDVESEILEDVELGYGGMGIVVGPGVVIGRNSFIAQGVTLEALNAGGTAPVLGRDVLVCAGAKVLGQVRIGDGAVVGANAVVLEDVGPGEVVAGIPARRIRGRVAEERRAEALKLAQGA
jgi:serine O-acetyltransferase